MQWFVVKYRKPDGAMAEAEFEAADRPSLFNLLAEKNITAISVASDRVDKKPRPHMRQAKGASVNVSRGLIAGLIVVVVAVAAWYFLSPSPASVPEVTPEKAPKLRPDNAKPISKSAEPEAVKAEEQPEDTNDPRRIVEVVSVTTNKGFGTISMNVRCADGTTGIVVKPTYKPTFRHRTDQLLQMTLCANPNVPIPPMPMVGGGAHDKEFLESLNDEIVIEDEDSDVVRNQKAIVINARAQIKDLMDKGYHFDEIIEDYRRLTSENLEIRNEAMRELNAIHAAGDTQGERAYQIRIDAALQQMGIDPLDNPMTPDERRAMRAERRAMRELEKQNNEENDNGH